MNEVLKRIEEMKLGKPADINTHTQMFSVGHHLNFEDLPPGKTLKKALCVPKPLSQIIKAGFGHKLMPVMNITYLVDEGAAA